MITVISSFFNESKNCERFFQMIEECSLLIPISEVVLVDNGSTDDTFSKLNNFKSKNFQINILQNPPNSKYGDGFNKAFVNANNGYILTLHSDLQFNLKNYILKNINSFNLCLKSKINIFPKRINRSFLSILRTYFFKIIISIRFLMIFNDFNGHPKLLIKKDFEDLNSHCSGFGYDLSLFFFLKKKKKKLNLQTLTIEEKRIHGTTSWNNNLLSSLNVMFQTINELNNFNKKNFKINKIKK